MLGADLYMACVDPKDSSIVGGTCSCMMCKRMVINAGIARVIIRDTKDEFRIIEVGEWIDNDDSLSGQFGY
jgi:dCMP deaminase